MKRSIISLAVMMLLLGIFATAGLSEGAERTMKRSVPFDEKVLNNALVRIPPALHWLINKYRSDFTAGFDESVGKAAKSKDQQIHRIRKSGERIINMLNRRKRMQEIIGEYGRLARLIMDFNDPLRWPGKDVGNLSARPEYAKFTEKYLSKFQVKVFDPRKTCMSLHQLPSYLEEKTPLLAEHRNALLKSFLKNGQIVSASTFGPQSLPYGIAYLTLTRSVTDITVIFYSVWKEGGGDVSYE